MEVEENNSADVSNIEITPCAVCKYCIKPENKQDKPGLTCINCNRFIHLTCLKRPGTPGDFSCDVFFEFTCSECSDNGEEVFDRKKFPWVNVLLLTLHHLNVQAHGISNNGFFHYKMHICSFIDRNWVLLFGTQIKQKKNWVGTIAGALSVYNSTFFMSGSVALGETGWWRLFHSFSPAVAAHINQELSKEKVKGRPRGHMSIDKSLFFAKVSELGYKHLVLDETNPQPVVNEAVPFKKRRFDIEQSEASCSNIVIKQEFDQDITIEEHQLDFHSKDSDLTSMFQNFGHDATGYKPAMNQQQSPHFYDSDSRSSPHLADEIDDRWRSETRKLPSDVRGKKTDEKPLLRRESLFSTEPNSVDLPWIEKVPEARSDLVEMTEYEEIQLLKRVEGMIAKVKDSNKKAHLHRFRAKLALRRLKRHKHLPIFNLDKAVKLLSGYAAEDPKVMNAERILDRFQRSYLLENLSGAVRVGRRGVVLVSRCGGSLRSPYSGLLLKQYIRRDPAAASPWLHLMRDLLAATHRHLEGYEPPPNASLDYSYVRPQHIAPVNSLLAQFFWPGIDVSESLQHPEFSCVVTYKKLVVACAFLVPDVGPNEAYISFILTRPEWRNAKIATFMLYHLLQTCTGKDVTLHVSPTNPAIFLYQKFGFKVSSIIEKFTILR
ncbi:unnamed protein product [Parnassius apollo]|uniref:(apollo) hypothetical protein n=1 Tax=Parnassius apollo TaxID=110799 RepID=A0A8S3WBX1_PARAO|nr:unnamed protein product [Parnassius apollo]